MSRENEINTALAVAWKKVTDGSWQMPLQLATAQALQNEFTYYKKKYRLSEILSPDVRSLETCVNKLLGGYYNLTKRIIEIDNSADSTQISPTPSSFTEDQYTQTQEMTKYINRDVDLSEILPKDKDFSISFNELGDMIFENAYNRKYFVTLKETGLNEFGELELVLRPTSQKCFFTEDKDFHILPNSKDNKPIPPHELQKLYLQPGSTDDNEDTTEQLLEIIEQNKLNQEQFLSGDKLLYKPSEYQCGYEDEVPVIALAPAAILPPHNSNTADNSIFYLSETMEIIPEEIKLDIREKTKEEPKKEIFNMINNHSSSSPTPFSYQTTAWEKIRKEVSSTVEQGEFLNKYWFSELNDKIEEKEGSKTLVLTAPNELMQRYMIVNYLNHFEKLAAQQGLKVSIQNGGEFIEEMTL